MRNWGLQQHWALSTGSRGGRRASRTVLALVLPLLAWLVLPPQAQAQQFQICAHLTVPQDNEVHDYSITDAHGDNATDRAVKSLPKNRGWCSAHFPWWLQSQNLTTTIALSGPGRSCAVTFVTQYRGRAFDYEIRCTVAQNNGCGVEVKWPSVTSAYVWNIPQCYYLAWLP